MLGEYQVERTLARGGMGTVFAAVHPLIGKRVAIKVLSRAQCSDPESVERFVDEARVVNRIGHPNIVDVFAFGAMPDGRQYLVMELLHGETLGARMAREGVSLADACSVMRQLARALAAAHAQGVIHRDLKPDNVFLAAVDGGSMVKLLDFGIAKLSYRDALTRTAVGVMMGTPQYIAPEQALGDTVDARSDIYAFGGILFELLAGRPAFVVRSPAEAIAKHLLEPAPRVSQFARVSPELDDLVAAMLAKEPEARPGLDRICEVLDHAAAAPQGLLAPPLAGGSSGTVVAIPAVAVSAPVAVIPAGSLPVRSGSSPAASRRSRLWMLAGALALVAGTLALVYLARLHTRSTPKRHAPIVASAPPHASTVAPPAARPAPTAPVSSPSEPPVAAAEPADPTADATSPAVSSSTGDGTPRGPAASRPHVRRTGRLALAIRGARSYVVVVDGVARGARSELALAPGPHAIEVRADGEPPRRFDVQIEAGKTEQRDVEWAHDAPAPAPPVDVDDHALMGPGQAVPRETPHK
ncbi:MAG TPA: protein kinase [Kofleriaceae bacterium]|jgi:serine/threonine-protein kinase|nr:protein kinase [Kofleriaceae bacterium]